MRKQIWLVALALAAAAPPPLNAAPAEPADECLAKPQGAPPEGRHWYYRLERPSQRKCWYLGDAKKPRAADTAAEDAEDEPEVATAAPVVPAAPAKRATSTVQAQPAPAKSAVRQPAVRQPIANARAELIEPRAEDSVRSVPQAQADVVPDVTGGMTSRAWAAASRWADATSQPSAFGGGGGLSSPAPSTAPADRVMAQVAPADASQKPSPAAIAASPAPPEPALAQAETRGDFDYLLLALCGSMFAFAAFMAVTIFRASRPLDLGDFPSERYARRGSGPMPDGDLADDVPSAVFAAKPGARVAQPAPPTAPRQFEDEVEELDRLLSAARGEPVKDDRRMSWHRG